MQNTPFSIILAAEGEVLLSKTTSLGVRLIETTKAAVISASPASRWW
jgi:hypothetical protein